METESDLMKYGLYNKASLFSLSLYKADPKYDRAEPVAVQCLFCDCLWIPSREYFQSWIFRSNWYWKATTSHLLQKNFICCLILITAKAAAILLNRYFLICGLWLQHIHFLSSLGQCKSYAYSLLQLLKDQRSLFVVPIPVQTGFWR